MRGLIASIVLAGLTMFPLTVNAQAVSAEERQSLAKLGTDRGGRPGDVDALIRIADETGAKGLPVEPLTNKIREGLAKRKDPKLIETVIRQIATELETADRLLRDLVPGADQTGRGAAVTLLAESLSGGITADEVRQLNREVSQAGTTLGAESLSSAAKSLSLIKDARLPVPEGAGVLAEAARHGYRARDLVDLGREVKRRERDYQSGRATLRTLREAIARGDRPEQVVRDARPAVERPATRPDTPERPERPTRPDVQRPERVERPARP